MKTNVTRRSASALALAAVVAGIWGCATTADTEGLLAKAGFKAVPAVTPEQQVYIQSLPARQITMMIKDGTNYYVFPDRGHLTLYVGQTAEYEEYRKLQGSQNWVKDVKSPSTLEADFLMRGRSW